MYTDDNSIGLPAGIITTFSNGCKGYQPLKKVPFSPQIEQEFNPTLAAWSINACTYAYQDLCNKNDIIYPPDVENGKLLYWNDTPSFFPKPKISSGYIAKIKDLPNDPTNRVGIFFRGTQTNDEWSLDADYKQTEVMFQPSGDLVKIHQGFWNIVNKPAQKGFPSLKEQVETLLPNYLSPNGPNELHIGGHSMGSAVSLLIAINAILKFPGVTINTYITGCPRVGNPAFVNAINDLAKNADYNFSIWRIANTEDVITTLPPPIIDKILYSHPLLTNPSDPNTVNLVSFTKNLGKIFDNHHLFNYYYAMKNLIHEENEATYYGIE